ncbi:MAG: hypothetical protein OHK0029_23400 [Armatimonadaceae bacterium]
MSTPVLRRMASRSALHPVLERPARPVPWYLWLLAAMVGALAGFGIASKVLGVLIFGGAFLLWGIAQTIARPIVGFYFCLAFYPFYTFFRGLAMYLKLPLPMSLLGLWPEVVLTIMGAGVIIGCIRSGQRLRLTWNDVPVGFLVASGVYAMLISLAEREPVAAVYGFHATVTPLIFYTVARWLQITRQDLYRAVLFWVIPFALLALLSLVDYFVRPQLTIEIAILVRDGFWKHWDPYMFFRWYPRMQSLMFSEQFWGTICGMVSVLCLSLWSLRPRPKWVVPVFWLALVCLVFSMSRGALIDWAVAIVVLMLFRGRHRVVVPVTVAVTVLAGVVLAIQFGDKDSVDTLVDRITALADSDNTNAYDRIGQWKYALEYFPLFPAGRGLGRAGSQALFHGTGDGSMAIADGGYFKIMAEEGLPGLLLFTVGGIGFVLVLLRLLQFYRNEQRNTVEYALGRALLCMLCGLLVHNVGGNIFDAYYIQPTFWLFAGFFVTHAEQQTARKTLPALHPSVHPPLIERGQKGETS